VKATKNAPASATSSSTDKSIFSQAIKQSLNKVETSGNTNVLKYVLDKIRDGLLFKTHTLSIVGNIEKNYLDACGNLDEKDSASLTSSSSGPG
jgi:hypothetical protein